VPTCTVETLRKVASAASAAKKENGSGLLRRREDYRLPARDVSHRPKSGVNEPTFLLSDLAEAAVEALKAENVFG
jgi:hypothetical protein